MAATTIGDRHFTSSLVELHVFTFPFEEMFFILCCVPKYYNFQKDSLAEIWVAEDFVEPQGDIPLRHIGGQYFEDLVNLSFFQELRGKLVSM